MKKITLALVTVTVCLAGYLFFSPGDEEKIKTLIDTGAKAVERENLSKTMSVFSLEYRDSCGLPYGSIRGAFAGLFDRFEDIMVAYTIRGIAIVKDTATVLLDVRVSAAAFGETGDIVGDEREPGILSMTLKKYVSKWLIISAQWRDLNALKSAGYMPALPMKEAGFKQLERQ